MVQAKKRYWLRPWSATTHLGVSTVVGFFAWLALRQVWPASLSGILAWNAGVVSFLLVTHRVIADHSIASIKRRAAAWDTRTAVIKALG
jgi:hypothetical protein